MSKIKPYQNNRQNVYSAAEHAVRTTTFLSLPHTSVEALDMKAQ